VSERAAPRTRGRLRRLLFGSSEPASSTDDDLALLHTRLEGIERVLDDLARAARAPAAEPPAPQGQSEGPALRPAALEERLAGLEKQINRAGREQLRLNTLIEAQTEQQRAALEALEAANARRDDEIRTLREQLRAAQKAARLDMVTALLPALDSLDEAVRAGRQLLAKVPARQRRGLFGRLRAPEPSAGEQALRESMAAWLDGLRFVRSRLLELLAAEGVVPMEPEGRPFDPHRHSVLEVVAASDEPPGNVVATLRQGYLAGERVLRHAEVAVAGEAGRHETGRGERREKQR
jgi:molecular chaperone GrpE